MINISELFKQFLSKFKKAEEPKKSPDFPLPSEQIEKKDDNNNRN